MYSIWKYLVLQFNGNLKTTSKLCHIQLCALLTVVMMEVCKSLYFYFFPHFKYFWYDVTSSCSFWSFKFLIDTNMFNMIVEMFYLCNVNFFSHKHFPFFKGKRCKHYFVLTIVLKFLRLGFKVFWLTTKLLWIDDVREIFNRSFLCCDDFHFHIKETGKPNGQVSLNPFKNAWNLSEHLK